MTRRAGQAASTVRPARPADLAGLPTIERAAAALFPPERITDPSATLPAETLTGCQQAGLLWVAETTRLAGFLAARREGEDLFVLEVDVHPAEGRQGLGTALLETAVRQAEARNCRRVTLTTFADIPWNAPFYRRLGFVELDAAGLTPSLERQLAAERGMGLTGRVAMARTLEGAP